MMKKRIQKAVLFFIISCCLFNVNAIAAEEAVIVEKYTVEDDVILYVDGVEGEIQEISFQIGNTFCSVEEYNTINNLKDSINTLIVWDNSLSVMKNHADTVKDILLDIVANRTSGEKISIVITGKEKAVLCDYTNDYTVLKQTIASVEKENKYVYLIDNLYECIEELSKKEDATYQRIILISDGSIDTGTGYTRSELEQLISLNPFPIYTIGMGENEDQLKDVFAFARATGAESFYVAQMDNHLDITKRLAEDGQIVQVRVNVLGELLDGSSRNSRISIKTEYGEYSAQCMIKLPFLSEISGGVTITPTLIPTESPEKPTETPVPTQGEATVTPTITGAKDEASDKNGGGNVIVFVLIGVVCVVAALAVLLMTVRKRSQKITEESAISSAKDANKTEIMTEKTEILTESSGEKTEQLFDTNTYRFQLTCVNDSIITYRCSISSEKITIGRSASKCNMTIDDKSVSGAHCEVYVRGQRFYVRDVGSSNGTYVDGRKIYDETEIQTGTILKLGQTEYRVMIG